MSYRRKHYPEKINKMRGKGALPDMTRGVQERENISLLNRCIFKIREHCNNKATRAAAQLIERVQGEDKKVAAAANLELIARCSDTKRFYAAIEMVKTSGSIANTVKHLGIIAMFKEGGKLIGMLTEVTKGAPRKAMLQMIEHVAAITEHSDGKATSTAIETAKQIDDPDGMICILEQLRAEAQQKDPYRTEQG